MRCVGYATTMQSDSNSVGTLIRELRTRAGLTQQHVAQVCGVKVSAVSKWERGAVPVPVGQLDNISQALGTDLRVRAPLDENPDLERLRSLAKELSPEQLASVLVIIEALVKKK